jgi:hypothetical protein
MRKCVKRITGRRQEATADEVVNKGLLTLTVYCLVSVGATGGAAGGKTEARVLHCNPHKERPHGKVQAQRGKQATKEACLLSLSFSHFRAGALAFETRNSKDATTTDDDDDDDDTGGGKEKGRGVRYGGDLKKVSGGIGVCMHTEIK